MRDYRSHPSTDRSDAPMPPGRQVPPTGPRCVPCRAGRHDACTGHGCTCFSQHLAVAGMTAADVAELRWWRDFGSRLEEAPRVGSGLGSQRFRLQVRSRTSRDWVQFRVRGGGR